MCSSDLEYLLSDTSYISAEELEKDVYKRQAFMIPRIKEVKALPNFNLRVLFDDGKAVRCV